MLLKIGSLSYCFWLILSIWDVSINCRLQVSVEMFYRSISLGFGLATKGQS